MSDIFQAMTDQVEKEYLCELIRDPNVLNRKWKSAMRSSERMTSRGRQSEQRRNEAISRIVAESRNSIAKPSVINHLPA